MERMLRAIRAVSTAKVVMSATDAGTSTGPHLETHPGAEDDGANRNGTEVNPRDAPKGKL